MTPEKITSRTNPLMTHIRKLATSSAYRRKSGEFVCDGFKLLQEAQQWKAPVTTVVFAEGVAMPDCGAGIRMVQVPEDVMCSIAPSETPQGVLFLCKMEQRPLPEKLEGAHYVALDGVQDPGNVGTILRTADAFACDGMFLLNACADLYSPKTVRATMGAVFRCPVWKCSPAALRVLLEASGLPLYGAALRADTIDAREASYDRAVVAVGSEGRGLSEEVLSLCDKTIRIPMSARCESLNAAIAAGVLLWEMYR